jgi:hypothetical protein
MCNREGGLPQQAHARAPAALQIAQQAAAHGACRLCGRGAQAPGRSSGRRGARAQARKAR